MPDILLLKAQTAFKAVWDNVGLSSVCPLRFDSPKVEDPVPYGKASLKTTERWRYTGGYTARVRVTVELRIQEGDTNRLSIEQKISLMDQVGKTVSGQVEFLPMDILKEMDEGRYGGVAVERIPFAWEIWIEVPNGRT